MKRYLPILILLGLWIFAGFALLQPGFIPTHDGEYHLIRFYDFFSMLTAGYWFPRWAPGLNSGYGVPLFNFFYPLPNYVGSLFHALGVDLSNSFKFVLFVSYATAGVASYLWLKKLFDAKSALVGAIVFSFVPYWFVDMYVRGSVGEVLGLACVMIVICAVEYNKKAVVALGVAGLILSHNILAMLFAPFLLLYILLRNKKVIWHYFAGFLLSAYFWVPALVERQYVTGLNTVNFRDHFPDILQLVFPSWGTNFSQSGTPYDEMSQQIGIIPLFVFVVAGFLAIKASKAKKEERRLRVLLVGILGVMGLSVVLMLPASEKIWELASPLQLLQYPWRLLSFIIPTAGLAAAYITSRSKHFWIPAGFAFTAVLLSLPYVHPNVYAPRNDAYYLSRPEFTDGTSSLGNGFSTIWKPWISTRAKERVEIIGGEGSIIIDEMKPTDYRFHVVTSKPALIRVNSVYYPGWQAVVDSKSVPIEYKNGLIQVPVFAGRHTIRVYFGETPFRRMVDLVSLLSLCGIIAHGILESIYAHRH